MTDNVSGPVSNIAGIGASSGKTLPSCGEDCPAGKLAADTGDRTAVSTAEPFVKDSAGGCRRCASIPAKIPLDAADAAATGAPDVIGIISAVGVMKAASAIAVIFSGVRLVSGFVPRCAGIGTGITDY